MTKGWGAETPSEKQIKISRLANRVEKATRKADKKVAKTARKKLKS